AALMWFPEGWRSPDGRLLPFLPGIGEVLQRVEAKVVPLYIAGSFEAMPRGARLPRPRPVRIVIGQPMPPSALAESGGVGEGTAQQIADRLRHAVAALAHPAARGTNDRRSSV